MTPINIHHASQLHSLFPDMLLVHSVRDGRDTACSLVARRWIPSVCEAIEWWAPRMESALRAARRLPASSLLVVELEDLVVRDRESSYERLVQVLGGSNEDKMREFFERSVRQESAHIGRWRRELSEREGTRLTDRYKEVLSEFQARGLLPPRSEVV
jgi:hypothetical protein